MLKPSKNSHWLREPTSEQRGSTNSLTKQKGFSKRAMNTARRWLEFPILKPTLPTPHGGDPSLLVTIVTVTVKGNTEFSLLNYADTQAALSCGTRCRRMNGRSISSGDRLHLRSVHDRNEGSFDSMESREET